MALRSLGQSVSGSAFSSSRLLPGYHINLDPFEVAHAALLHDDGSTPEGTACPSVHGEKAFPFDRKNNVGLHHLAFSISTVEALDAMHERLKDAPGVTIEFAAELNQGGPAKHMMIRELSSNRIEFIHRPSDAD